MLFAEYGTKKSIDTLPAICYNTNDNKNIPKEINLCQAL